MDPFLNLRLRIVAEQRPGLRNVCKGLRHIAWLHWLLLDDGIQIQFPLDQGNQFSQFNGSRLPEINHFVVASVVIDRRTHSRNDVVDVGVVTTRQAIAKYRDRFSRADQTSEFVNGQVGSLPRSVHRKEAQTDTANAVEVRISVTD